MRLYASVPAQISLFSLTIKTKAPTSAKISYHVQNINLPTLHSDRLIIAVSLSFCFIGFKKNKPPLQQK